MIKAVNKTIAAKQKQIAGGPRARTTYIDPETGKLKETLSGARVKGNNRNVVDNAWLAELRAKTPRITNKQPRIGGHAN